MFLEIRLAILAHKRLRWGAQACDLTAPAQSKHTPSKNTRVWTKVCSKRPLHQIWHHFKVSLEALGVSFLNLLVDFLQAVFLLEKKVSGYEKNKMAQGKGQISGGLA